MTIISAVTEYGMGKKQCLCWLHALGTFINLFQYRRKPPGTECFFFSLKKPMINERLIMNFAEEQEELSLCIWACLELDGRSRQAKKAVQKGLRRGIVFGSGCQSIRDGRGTAYENDEERGFGMHEMLTQHDVCNIATKPLLCDLIKSAITLWAARVILKAWLYFLGKCRCSYEGR